MVDQGCDVYVVNVTALSSVFLSKKEMKGSGVAQAARQAYGAGVDELIVKGLAAGGKGLFNLGRRGVAEGIKSDFARNKIKSIGHQYLDRLVDSTTDDLSKKIAGKGVARGAGVDIHKAIGRLPKPKSGWTLPGHKYTGPFFFFCNLFMFYFATDTL